MGMFSFMLSVFIAKLQIVFGYANKKRVYDAEKMTFARFYAKIMLTLRISWHINFCPGWKGYFTSLPEEEQKALREKYNFTKYQ